MEFYGFIGLLFKESKIEIIGININTSENVINKIKKKFYYEYEDTGINIQDVSYNFLTATRYSEIFFMVIHLK